MDQTLRNALLQQSHERLTQIAASWSLAFRGNPTQKLLVDQIAASMLDPQRFAKILSSLPPQAIEGIRALAGEKSLPRLEFERRYGDLGVGRPSLRAQENVLTPSAMLHLMGLAYVARSEELQPGGDRVEVVWTPVDLAVVATKALSNTGDLGPELKEIPAPASYFDAGFGVVATIAYALAYVRDRGYLLTKTGEVSKAYLAKFTEHIYGKGEKDRRVFDGPPPLWIYPILTSVSLIRDGLVQNYELTPESVAYAKTPRAEQVKSLFYTWKKFQVTYQASQPSYRDGFAHFMQDWTSAFGAKVRDQLLAALAMLHVGHWYRLDHPTILALAKTDPAGVVSPHQYRYLSYGTARGQDALPAFTIASAVSIILGPLAWFGVVLLDQKPGGREPVTAFSLSPFGRWLLDEHHDPFPETASAPIVVQPNYEVLLPREATFQDVLDVERICTLVNRDVASTYTLTKQSVGGALASGMTQDAVIGALVRASRKLLPANVTHAVREWTRSYGRIRVKQGTFLVTDTALLLTELRLDRKLQGLIKENVEERVAVVADRLGPTLVKRLRELGHLPLADASLDQVAGSQVRSSSDDELDATFTVAELRNLFSALEIAALYIDVGDPLSARVEDLQSKLYALASDRVRDHIDADIYAVIQRYAGDQGWADVLDVNADTVSLRSTGDPQPNVVVPNERTTIIGRRR